MIKFSDFLFEREFLRDPEQTLENVNELLKYMKPLQNDKLLWRGFHGANKIMKSGIAVLDNDRGDNFYGGVHSKSKDIIKEIGIKNITFVLSGKHSLAEFYGTPLIFVPMDKMTPWYSDLVDDIMVAGNEMETGKENKFQDMSAKELAKTYKKGISTKHETLVDVDKYALIDPIKILQIVPAWIEKKMGYSKGIEVSQEEKDLAFNFQYNKSKITPEIEDQARYAARKQSAKQSARAGSTTSFGIEFHFNGKLDSYKDLYEYMKLFKSYIEFMIKNKK